METLEELKEIIDNAPDEATHIDGDKEYVKFIECEMYHYSCEWASVYDFPLELRSLSDIERIIELMEATQDLLQVFAGSPDGYWRNELNAARKVLGYKV